MKKLIIGVFIFALLAPEPADARRLVRLKARVGQVRQRLSRSFRALRQRLPHLGRYRGRHAKKKGRGQGGLLARFRRWRANQRRGAHGKAKQPVSPLGRLRRWRRVRRAYKTGKRAARSGDLETANKAVETISKLRGPNNWRIRSRSWFHRVRGRGGIEDAALGGARRMARRRNPEGAAMLLDFARQIERGRGRHRVLSRRYRRVRAGASRRIWRDLRRRARNGNIEGFRSAMNLLQAYAQEKAMARGEHGRAARLPGRQARRIRRLYMKAMKRSVPRALKEAKQLLAMGQPADSPEVVRRLEYAGATLDRLASRGVTLRHGLLRRKVRRKLEKVRGRWARKMLQSQMEPPRRGLFTRWWMTGGGRQGPGFMPTPRTLNRVAVDRRMQREQRKVEMVLRKFEAGTITEEQADRVLNTVPPQMLQQMGFMPPPQQLM
jgi:hypothetical protein